MIDLKPKVAALFVCPKGLYSKDPIVDCWDQKRDARKYDNTLPVVAHPPCNLWVNFASLNYKRWGGEHNRPGNDGGCFESALKSVRNHGGVLEHPAFTKAWPKYLLDRPKGIGWTQVSDSEWVCEVWQSAYGHKARKRTWLFYSGERAPFELNWSRKPGTHQIGGFHDGAFKKTVTKKEAIHTPKAFKEALVQLAIWSKHA